jgi:chromosome segregation ATPase
LEFAKMADLEKRLAAVEARLTAMEQKRRELLGDLDENPAVRLVLRDSIDGFKAELQSFAEQKNVDEAVTRFNAARQEAYRELERLAKEGEQKELAEFVAAIEYYERTGQSPPGYDISG